MRAPCILPFLTKIYNHRSWIARLVSPQFKGIITIYTSTKVCFFAIVSAQKTFDQIANLPDSYLAIDNVEVGNGNRILLWTFGCLYQACSINSEAAVGGYFGKPVEILRNFDAWPIEAPTSTAACKSHAAGKTTTSGFKA